MNYFFSLFVLIFTASSCVTNDIRIVVDKSNREMKVMQRYQTLHKFRIALGKSPIGDKERKGDGKTPEGNFSICVKNAHSQFYRSLGINYPNAEDADRGLRQGLISQVEHRRIVAASKRNAIPPWKTKLGGEIYIHPGGCSADWTRGCMALNQADMKVLFDLIPVGTQIEIRP
jgi:murein L,D-transpeptidase YafK